MSISSIEVYRAPAGVLRWRDDWLWHFDHATDHELTPVEIDRLLEAVRLFRRGRKAPLLVERRHTSGDALAPLTGLASGAPALLTAIAFCVSAESPGTATMQLVRHFFGQGLSVEVFREEEAAAEWLKAFARD